MADRSMNDEFFPAMPIPSGRNHADGRGSQRPSSHARSRHFRRNIQPLATLRATLHAHHHTHNTGRGSIADASISCSAENPLSVPTRTEYLFMDRAYHWGMSRIYFAVSADLMVAADAFAKSPRKKPHLP